MQDEYYEEIHSLYRNKKSIFLDIQRQISYGVSFSIFRLQKIPLKTYGQEALG